MNDSELALLALYRELHDGLSNMVEEGRLTEADIPDDYQWLVEKLVDAVALGQKVEDAA